MKKVLGAAALAAVGCMAQAGGIDRSGQGISTLFEPGELVEFTFGYVSPDVVGSGSPLNPPASSGDAGPGYGLWSMAYKRPLNDKVDLGLIIDQPFGADIDYPAGTGYPMQGSSATLRSTAITALARYHFSERFSLHGGLRAQRVTGEAVVTPVPGYTLDAESDVGIGYSLGVAYEIPDIALRAVLTWNSSVSHSVDSTETGPVPSTAGFDMTTPQSINLDFQTGIAEGTLLMASVRWVEWSKFDITPPGYNTVPGDPLVEYGDDRFSYTLGIGRRFSDQWAGSVTLGYEPAVGGTSSNLSPTDGYKSLAVGASYTQGNMKISGGLRYIEIGDTVSNAPISGNFSGNTGWAAGLKVSYTF